MYTVYNDIINFNEKIKMDIVDPINNQNPASKKIHGADINRLNNSIINRNKYYYNNNLGHNNGKTVKLRYLSHVNTVTSALKMEVN